SCSPNGCFVVLVSLEPGCVSFVIVEVSILMTPKWTKRVRLAENGLIPSPLNWHFSDSPEDFRDRTVRNA
ncbi:MAG TPA: hypothetical protein VJ884_01585, partial [Salinibacter sp.]|nr:hypothetical protein [Salinibacter sp.]